ncbi:MAG: flagellar basal-body rod protein FlgG, partial [Planctomycetota bacterium]
MLKSLYTTATGMRAQQTMVDMIANNIANVNTTGFKKSQASFEDLLYVTQQSPGLARGTGTDALPIGVQIGSGTRLNGTTKIYSSGTLEGTERSLDVAIDGDGFFAVLMPDGTTAYTRNGNFQVNATGKLVTSNGNVLVPEITLPQDVLDVSIDPEGRVNVRTAGSPEQTQQLGQLQLHRFVNPSGLLALGANVMRPTEASGQPITGQPGQLGLGMLRSGFLERSNVQIVNELV